MRSAVLGLILIAAAAAPAFSQHLAVTLRSVNDSQAVAGALVVLFDSTGRQIATTISSERGQAAFRSAGAGTVVFRVLRIGHQPWQSEPVRLSDRASRSLDLWVPNQPIQLAAITVEANRGGCGIPLSGTLLGQLLEEANKALALTQATLDERRIRFALEVWRRRLSAEGLTIDSVGFTSSGGGWPIQSADPESLRVGGFVRQETDSSGGFSTVYYGPDARVLFADWFLASRCLQVRAPDRRRPGLLTVEFRPAGRRAGTDIGGEFVFDSTTLELQELRWHWRNLPAWVPRNDPGGFVRFRRLPGGEWLPTEWSLRAPMPEVNQRAEIRLSQYAEMGGRVTSINSPR